MAQIQQHTAQAPTHTPSTLEPEFRRRIEEYLREDLRKIEMVWASLTPEQIWQRPNEHCLAPANQLIHLTGNLRQWVLTNLDGQPDVRERDGEFAARSGPGKAQILADFQSVFAEVFRVLQAPIAADGALRIQGHDTTPVGVWIHVVEHLSYHTGQLIFFAKSLLDQPYDFYAGWDLNAVGAGRDDPTTPPPLTTNLTDIFGEYRRLIGAGQYLDAITRYYAEDIVQFENDDEPKRGRDLIVAAERAAEKRVASANIAITDAVIDESRGLVWGEMEIHFMSKEGLEQRLLEAFRQNWAHGLIVEQRFYYKGFETV